jgi:hypothetical protein
MRSPFSYIVGSTYVLFLSLVPALAPAMAEEGFTPAHRYPKEVIVLYMNACMSSRLQNVYPKLIGQMCYCGVQAVQDKYSLAQFLRIGRQTEATGKVPPEAEDIAVGCARAVLNRANSK